MRTVFLGSPPFATPVLQRLAASPHRPAALITPPDRPRGRGRSVSVSPLVSLANELDIPVLQPANPHDALDELRALEPEVLVIASYGVILKPSLLELAPLGCLNVHGSLLPRHRGASPIQAAILAGDAETGVTIQRLVEELDAGDVLLERRRPIGPGETSGELFDALAPLGGEALVEALDQLADGSAVFTPQDPAGVTFARKLKKVHGRLDWTRPAAELERRVRAMTPWPGARFLDPKGREMTLAAASVVDGAGEPGQVLEARERFVVAAGERALELRRVAPAGKREMDGSEYLRGARIETGANLPPWPEN
jgi:methionyl-tRNA formyltransferase